MPKTAVAETDPASDTVLESSRNLALYRDHVNPQWVKLLDLLQMNVKYKRCEGVELFTDDGRRILDFLSGYCVHNTGHNHPRIVSALQAELARFGPAMLQSHVPELAGELAARLCERSGGRLQKCFFCSSGSEGIEAVIKFARACTGRSGIVYASGAFHGLTCGALSMMAEDSFWRRGFGPLLASMEEVKFGDLEALERRLATRAIAAVVLEPIQGEAGIRIPGEGYLPGVQALCRKYGTLFVLDEVQTGLGRTGKFLAAHHYGAEPDMAVLAKALSGGLIPVGAVLMSDKVYNSVYDSLKRAIIHTSTYSENGLAMRAGLATLQVLEDEGLARQAERLGHYIRERLRARLASYEMVKEVRGVGLMSGIEFAAPQQLRLRIAFEAFKKIHAGMFGQMIVMRLFRDKNILTQICGNNFMVLKVAPPLVVNEQQCDEFVAAVGDVVEAIHSSGAFWSDALGLAGRAINI
jgi:ornithine--oxo-acid transaminase